jgi:ribosomal protein S1
MDATSFEIISKKFPCGQIINGIVKHHTNFGVFVNIGDDYILGLIEIPYFLDEDDKRRIPLNKLYPKIGTLISARVIGYSFSLYPQVYLSIQPKLMSPDWVSPTSVS